MHRRGMPVCCGEVLRWGALGYDVPAPDVIHRGTLECCDEVLCWGVMGFDVPVSGGLHHGTLVCWGILPGERAVDALAPLRVSLL